MSVRNRHMFKDFKCIYTVTCWFLHFVHIHQEVLPWLVKVKKTAREAPPPNHCKSLSTTSLSMFHNSKYVLVVPRFKTLLQYFFKELWCLLFHHQLYIFSYTEKSVCHPQLHRIIKKYLLNLNVIKTLLVYVLLMSWDA